MLRKIGFRLSRSSAHKLLYVCIVVSFIGSIFSLDLLALVMRYCVAYRPYLKLLGSSYTLLFPLVLATCSIFSLLVHVTGIFLCWRLTFINFVWQYSAVKHRCFSIYRISLVILSVFILIAVIVNALCLSETVHEFEEGFKPAISNYRNNFEVRISMNELQYRFKCCGSQNYKDWFYSPWHSKDFPVLKSQKFSSLPNDTKVLYLQDTPFSCCNSEVLHPCLHTNILKNHFQSGLSYNVNPTIYQEGCLNSFRNRFTIYLKISVVYLLAFLLALCLALIPLVYIASYSKTYSAVNLEYWKKLNKLDTPAPGTSSKVEKIIKKAKQKFQKIKRARKFGSFTRIKSSKSRKQTSRDVIRPSNGHEDGTYEEIPLITFSNVPASLHNGLETLESEHSSTDSSEDATDGLSSDSDFYSQMTTVKATMHHPDEKQQESSPWELRPTQPDNGDALTRQEDRLITPSQPRSKRSRKDIATKRNLITRVLSFPSLSVVNGATTKPQDSTPDVVLRRKVVSEGNPALSEKKITDKETGQENDGSEIPTVADSTNLTLESSSLPSTVQKPKSEQDTSETSDTQRTTNKTSSTPTAPPPKPPRRTDLSKNDSLKNSSNNRNNFSFSNVDDSEVFTCNSKSTYTNRNSDCTALSYSTKYSNKAEESFEHSSNGKVTFGLSMPSECSTNLTTKSTCHSRNLSNITQSAPPFSICESPEDHFTFGIGSSEFEEFRYSNVTQHNNTQGDCLPVGNNEPYSSFHYRRFPSNLLLSDDTESNYSLFDENILEKFYGFRRLPKPNNRPYFKQIGFDIDPYE